MKKILWLCWLCIPLVFLSAQIPLKDSPAKGEWDFHPEKVWEVGQAGNEDFGTIGELLVLDDSLIVCRDFDRKISYLFDTNGKFIKSFAAQGNEPGQLSFYLNRFRAGDKIVLASPDKLCYFSRDGVFERAVDNNLFLRFPLAFLTENEFVYAPNLPQSPVQERKLMRCDLVSGKEQVLADFSGAGAQAAGAAKGPMLMIPSLTPQVRLATGGGKMVFGRNDRYEIFIADRAGRILSSFSLDRKKGTVTLDDKRLLVAELKMPEERKAQIAAQLPDEMTFFSHLDSVGGLIYVFAISAPGAKTVSQQVDIFSETGDYLYRGVLSFGDGLKFSGAANLVITGGQAYVILEDGQGRRTLAKYRIRLPK